MSELGPQDGAVLVAACRAEEDHQPDRERGGCTCGFCVWSPNHLAMMVAGRIERTVLNVRDAESQGQTRFGDPS